MITQAAEDAARFATRPTRDWWDTAVRNEIRYTLLQIRFTRDRRAEWDRLERRLAALCRTHERNEAA